MQTVIKAAIIIGLSTLAVYNLALWAPWPGRYQMIESREHWVRVDTATGYADVMRWDRQKGVVYWYYTSYIPPVGKGEWDKYKKETEERLRK